jgi:hypothetical protein
MKRTDAGVAAFEVLPEQRAKAERKVPQRGVVEHGLAFGQVADEDIARCGFPWSSSRWATASSCALARRPPRTGSSRTAARRSTRRCSPASPCLWRCARAMRSSAGASTPAGGSWSVRRGWAPTRSWRRCPARARSAERQGRGPAARRPDLGVFVPIVADRTAAQAVAVDQLGAAESATGAERTDRRERLGAEHTPGCAGAGRSPRPW